MNTHDLVAPRDGAGDAQRRHHGFGARVAERHALVAGELAEELGDLAGELGLRADGKTFGDLRRHRFDDEVGGMAESRLAIAVDEIDILVAVDVPDPRALRARADDGIDELLPLGPKAGNRARIGENGPIGFGQALGAGGPGVVALSQPIDMPTLFRRQLRGARVTWLRGMRRSGRDGLASGW